jgi:benzoyl-CoA reductase/2-hydroxyglutaryl-CoA dehydratase subunit BcrC/BadD/HgdB
VFARAAERRRGERKAELDRLAAREDCLPELQYFLSLYAEDPTLESIGGRTGLRPAAILCLQAPVELFWAQGFSPVKIYSGAYASANLTSPRLPALMCPCVKAILGEMELDPGLALAPWAIPLTCDWLVKFGEARGLFGGFSGPVHLVEVPRVKEDPRARARWLSEIRSLSGFLKDAGGRPLKRADLLAAVRRMEEARRALASLTLLRREGLVPAVWYSLITGAFFLDAPGRWTGGVDGYVSALRRSGGKGGEGAARGRRRADAAEGPGRDGAEGGRGQGAGGDGGAGAREGGAGEGSGRGLPAGMGPGGGPGAGEAAGGAVPPEAPRPDGVYLTGAPVYFPNFKVLHLMEEAGLKCLGDDLCSSERLFPRHVEVSDSSAEGLLAALAEAYHRGCLCPVFSESERRAALIREAADQAPVRGVVFHLLKGCHPYELDSFALEGKVTGWGLKFLKIETDYSTEDTRNLLTRLEAFRPTLGV